MEEKKTVSKDTKNPTYREVFKANYEGTSAVAKSIEEYTKKNYKDNVYLPWATMERVVYELDEEAYFENLRNEKGGLVHSDIIQNKQTIIKDGVTINETETSMMAHFVKVALIFMGKTFIEDYPIQDSKYEAVKVIDQNLVNKSLQRAKAKIAARATGVGLKLYEGQDLQFDEKEALPKPEVKEKMNAPEVIKQKPTEEKEKKVKEPIFNVIKDIEIPDRVETNNEVIELANYIKDKKSTDLEDKMVAALKGINQATITKFGFVLSVDDKLEELISKLSKVSDITKFTKTIHNLMNK